MPRFDLPRYPFQPGSGSRGVEYPPIDPELHAILAARLHRDDFFPALLGVKLAEARRGYARLVTENTPQLCQAAGVMHGGASFGMGDTAAAFALMSVYGLEAVLLTIEMKINYLEPIPPGPVEAEAFVMRATPRTAYIEIDIWSQGRLAARATTTYAIRMPKTVPQDAGG